MISTAFGFVVTISFVNLIEQVLGEMTFSHNFDREEPFNPHSASRRHPGQSFSSQYD